ncbi:hypothetical protein ECG_09344 [Echinococcus granulosus]|nr:hypothetical protein ECG_09344 [Echinococcus granulosus]
MSNVTTMKMSNFPNAIVFGICQYLSLQDLYNICCVIPNWQRVFSSQAIFRQQARRWNWMDKQLCELLLRGKPSFPLPNTRDSLYYRWSAYNFFNKCLREIMSKEIFVVQKCLCLSSKFDTDLLSYLREDCSLRSIGPWDQTFSLSDSTRATCLAEFIRGNYLEYNYFSLCRRDVISSRREEDEKVIYRVNKHVRESVESSDVVLYVFRCKNWESVRLDLKGIGRIVAHPQTLLLVGITDGVAEEQNHFGCVADMICHLGSVDGDVLAQMPVNWQVCCLHGADTADTHRLTIVELIAIELAGRWAKGC